MKTTYRKFEINRFQANNHCPCGKRNRDGKFATEKGYSGQPVGHCHSCGQDFWAGDETIVKKYQKQDYEIPNFCTPDTRVLVEQFDSNMESGFVLFLLEVFGEIVTREIVEKYYLGFYGSAHAEHKPDVIFWQFDINNNLRAGKIMSYNDKGKRQGVPRWWHKLTGSDCQIKQCFFGEHLLFDSNKPIAVVESEKTACIMSYCNPAFTWIASGTKNGLQYRKCQVLEGRDVILFPDHLAYDEWFKVAREWGFEISQESELWFEKGLIEEKGDIADYYLNLRAMNKTEKIDPEWSQAEYDSIFKPDTKILDSLLHSKK